MKKARRAAIPRPGAGCIGSIHGHQQLASTERRSSHHRRQIEARIGVYVILAVGRVSVCGRRGRLSGSARAVEGDAIAVTSRGRRPDSAAGFKIDSLWPRLPDRPPAPPNRPGNLPLQLAVWSVVEVESRPSRSEAHTISCRWCPAKTLAVVKLIAAERLIVHECGAGSSIRVRACAGGVHLHTR